jgi:cysteine desulfuration protein SufE
MNAAAEAGNLEPRQREIVEEFALFGDWSERYQYLIDLGRALQPLSPDLMNDRYKVSGCQSQVWIVPHGDQAALRFEATSDSAIVAGLIALLMRVYSDRSARDIAATEPSFVAALGLQSHLSPTRSNGLHAMLKTIKRYADEALQGSNFS